MTRHGKNCTAGAVYTYHERKKDAEQSGFGSKNVRLGKDSVKDFDCCSLTLQPCREPVITPDGYLYDKESILESLLHQKKEMARKTKAFEKQKRREEQEKHELKVAMERSKVERFEKLEKRLTTKPHDAFNTSKKDEPSTSTANNTKVGKELPSFWIPSLTPQAKPDEAKKPDTKTRCPMSGKPLRIKDLIPVKFTVAAGDDKSLITREVRYKCAVTHDALGNSVPCAVLANTGNVVTMDCVEKLIKKDMLCPFTSEKLKESDIVAIQRGGTGFSGSGVELSAKKDGPAMQV
ncbi:Nitric oxide synthase-interacting [Paramuricea clavata]|uniref:Nitric oxide synthase-interacting n=1 Tax=Paramuricea clavata TaxID=317549 RepID=A0A6S7IUU5_PARCT|nr:Nitric oxide synthase-interacting [Paramuricea clavata]